MTDEEIDGGTMGINDLMDLIYHYGMWREERAQTNGDINSREAGIKQAIYAYARGQKRWPSEVQYQMIFGLISREIAQLRWIADAHQAVPDPSTEDLRRQADLLADASDILASLPVAPQRAE